jgi:hypothetical protein
MHIRQMDMFNLYNNYDKIYKCEIDMPENPEIYIFDIDHDKLNALAMNFIEYSDNENKKFFIKISYEISTGLKLFAKLSINSNINYKYEVYSFLSGIKPFTQSGIIDKAELSFQQAISKFNNALNKEMISNSYEIIDQIDGRNINIQSFLHYRVQLILAESFYNNKYEKSKFNHNLHDDIELMSDLYSYALILINKFSERAIKDFHMRTLYALSLETTDYDKQNQCAINAIVTRSEFSVTMLNCSYTIMCIIFINKLVNIKPFLKWSPIKKLSSDHMKQIFNKFNGRNGYKIKNMFSGVLDIIKAHDYINKNLQYYIKKDKKLVFEYVNNFNLEHILDAFITVEKVIKEVSNLYSKDDISTFIDPILKNITEITYMGNYNHPINNISFVSEPKDEPNHKILKNNIGISASSISAYVSNVTQSLPITAIPQIKQLIIACDTLNCMKHFHDTEQFIEMRCNNKCILHYHLSCFKDISADMFHNSKLKRASWGDIVCLRPDCNGTICKIVQMNDHKNIRCIIIDLKSPVHNGHSANIPSTESYEYKKENQVALSVAASSIQPVNNNDQMPHAMLSAKWSNKISNTLSQDFSSSSSLSRNDTSLLSKSIKDRKTQHLEEFHQSLASSSLEGHSQLVQPQHINVSHSPSKYIYLNLCAEGITAVAITQINIMNPSRSISYPLTGKPIGVVFEFESAIEAEEIVLKLPELSLCYVNFSGCHLNFRASFLRHAK